MSPSSTDTAEVLRGRFADYDLAQVLQALSIGRQYVAVELSDEGGTRGTIHTKGGRVIGAQTATKSGLDALFALFELPTEMFRVYRMPQPAEAPEPLGLIGELIAEAKRRSPRPATGTSRPMSTASGSVAAVPPPGAARVAAPRPVPSPVPAVSSSVSSATPTTPAPSRPVTSPATPVPAAIASPVTARAPTPAPQPRATPAPPPAPAAAPQPRPARETARAPEPARPVVAVTSPKGGVGKTTLALNIALSLARHGHRTVLVDADVNGDIMSAIDARSRPQAGAYDVLAGRARLADCLLRTTIPELTIVPAVGQDLPDPALVHGDTAAAWAALFAELRADADVVVVDTAAGHFGPTYGVLRSATHLVGVLQAETIAHRSFGNFARFVSALPAHERPQVLGVVLNMLHTSEASSVEVLRQACTEFPPEWLFDVTIPRHVAFTRAASDGLPLGLIDEKNPPAVAWLFDGLAGELADRLKLRAPEPKKPRRLLL